MLALAREEVCGDPPRDEAHSALFDMASRGFAEFALSPRWCGYVDAIQRDGFLLKVLWRDDYPRENEGLDAGEVAVVLGRALPDGRAFRYRLAIPREHAERLFWRRRAALRLDLAQRIFAMSSRERDEFFQRHRWRRREGRPAKPALL